MHGKGDNVRSDRPEVGWQIRLTSSLAKIELNAGVSFAKDRRRPIRTRADIEIVTCISDSLLKSRKCQIGK